MITLTLQYIIMANSYDVYSVPILFCPRSCSNYLIKHNHMPLTLKKIKKQKHIKSTKTIKNDNFACTFVMQLPPETSSNINLFNV